MTDRVCSNPNCKSKKFIELTSNTKCRRCGTIYREPIDKNNRYCTRPLCGQSNLIVINGEWKCLNCQANYGPAEKVYHKVNIVKSDKIYSQKGAKRTKHNVFMCNVCDDSPLIEVDIGMTCKKCGRIYEQTLIDNTTFNGFQDLDKDNFGEWMIVPTNLSKKDKAVYIRNYLKVNNTDEPSHRLRANEVIKKAYEIIPQIPSIKRNEVYINNLKNTVKFIINQCYDTKTFVKHGNKKKLGKYKNNISKNFKSKEFSIPKDKDVTIATAILYGQEFVKGLNGGIMRDELIKTIKNIEKVDKHFESQISKFLNSIILKQVVDFSIYGYNKSNHSVEKYRYLSSVELFCNSQGFPIPFTTQVKDLLKQCNTGVWLSGKNPKNALGACIMHLIWDDCSKFKEFKFKNQKYTVRLMRINYPEKTLLKSIEEAFNVKGKVIQNCMKKIKRAHRCSQ